MQVPAPTTDEYIEEWHELQFEMDAIKKRLEHVSTMLMLKMDVGDVLTAANGEKVRKCDRGIIDPEALKQSISPSLWTSITKRVPVAALYKAQIEKGKLSQSTIDAATKRTKPWLEKR